MTASPVDYIKQLGVRERVLALTALAAAFAAVTLARLPVTEALSGYVASFFMLWLSVSDIKGLVLPNKLLAAWLVCRVCLMALTAFSTNSLGVPISSMLGSVAIGLLFLIVYYLSKRTLGGGDVKLSFVMGLTLTLSRVFTAVFCGLVFCSVFGLAGLILKKLKRDDFIPLGPFLFAGMIAAYLSEIGG